MITSTSNETIKDYMKLKQKKTRDEKGLYLVEGKHMTMDAIEARCVQEIITTDGSFRADVPVTLVSDRVMEKLAFTKTPQPYMAICKKQDNALQTGGCRYLLLDGVQDPGNLGTMIRTALAFGYDQLILSPDCVDLYNDKVLRSTQGALYRMNIIREDLDHVIANLRAQGVHVVGTSLHKAKPLDDIKIYERMAFIMGNEGQGMKEEILSMCDEALYIPIRDMESLNVAVAAGIIMQCYRGK